MKRHFFLATKVVCLALATYFAGIRLADYIVWNHLSEMPSWMYDTIRFTLDHTGNTDIREPDDLSIIAIFATIVACWITTASIALALYWVFVRLMKDRAKAKK